MRVENSYGIINFVELNFYSVTMKLFSAIAAMSVAMTLGCGVMQAGNYDHLYKGLQLSLIHI